MKKIAFSLYVALALGCAQTEENKPAIIEPAPQEFALVLHGGAGFINRERYSPEEDSAYRHELHTALTLGYKILEEGGTALQAVEQTIIYLEDCPLFNAGKGSVYNSEGLVENDASLMDGQTLNAGAVAGVSGVKNPISLARLVKDSTKHVMLAGTGAMQFAATMQVPMVAADYYYKEELWKEHLRWKEEQKMGTVGCVALDKHGNIAAGTSTGGMMHKKYGRIGDSPIIGAGTYAENNWAGVSCTGHGEYFIKNAVAYDLVAQMKYKGNKAQEAAENIILEKLKNQNALGGLIALDATGNATMVFNTQGMFRAYANSSGASVVALYGDE